MSHSTVNDNGVYIKMRNTNKLYCEVGENAPTDHMDDNQYTHSQLKYIYEIEWTNQ